MWVRKGKKGGEGGYSFPCINGFSNPVPHSTGASKILIFDHTIRRQAADPNAAPGRTPLRGPVQRVHIDQTYAASLGRVSHHLPEEEATALLQGRVQIINVWRPLAPVRRDPLAVARDDSVAEADLVPIGVSEKKKKPWEAQSPKSLKCSFVVATRHIPLGEHKHLVREGYYN